MFLIHFCAYLHPKLRKSANKSKTFLKVKYSIWVTKNAEFHADFEPVKMFFIKAPKKVISKNVTEICTFSFLFMSVKL